MLLTVAITESGTQTSHIIATLSGQLCLQDPAGPSASVVREINLKTQHGKKRGKENPGPLLTSIVLSRGNHKNMTFADISFLV